MTAHHNQSLFFVLKLRVALIFYKALVLPGTFFSCFCIEITWYLPNILQWSYWEIKFSWLTHGQGAKTPGFNLLWMMEIWILTAPHRLNLACTQQDSDHIFRWNWGLKEWRPGRDTPHRPQPYPKVNSSFWHQLHTLSSWLPVFLMPIFWPGLTWPGSCPLLWHIYQVFHILKV